MVYLLHFDRPYRHARHYVGTAEDVLDRIDQHKAGTGARLMQVLRQAGIGFTLARLWDGGREVERKIKQNRGGRYCPICRRERRQRQCSLFHQPHT